MPSKKSAAPARALRAHPHLYEINTLVWLESLSARLGRNITLADVPDSEWDTLARLGFDIVWLMGVWQRSPESRRVMLIETANFAGYSQTLPQWKPADVAGSPYAVKQYVPDARIGAWEGLDRVRDKLRQRGMALFLDFVGNHTAPDHPWVGEHPDFYVRLSPEECRRNPGAFFPADTKQGGYFAALGRDPYFPPWKDVAQLNYFDAALRAAMIAELAKIAQHCDGVRCDMAMLQLTDIFANIWGRFLGHAPRPAKEFWEEAHAAVPELILLAEAYWGTESRLLDLGFSFVYDKETYDAVRDSHVDNVRARLHAGLAYNSRLARFLENHDEPRRASAIGNDRLPAAAALMGTLPGLRFYQHGEIQGHRNRISIMLRAAAEEPPDPTSVKVFQKILEVSNREALHSGAWSLLEVGPEGDASSQNLIAYEWRLQKSWQMIVVNLTGGAAQGRLRLRDRVAPAQQYIFHDELNGVRYPRDGKELQEAGLFVRLEASQAHLFDITPA